MIFNLKRSPELAMKVIIIPVLSILFCFDFAFGQEPASPNNNVCGTADLTAYISNLKTKYIRPETRSNTITYYPIKIFSVGNNDGNGHMELLDIRESLCVLNEDFKDLNIQFYLLDNITRIDNDKYYEHTLSDGYEMMRKYNTKDAFNVYIVQSPNGNCGYFNTSNPSIAVSKDCFAGGTHTLTHEMGHQLGLPHTFFGWEDRTYNKTNVPKTLRIRGNDTLYTETVVGKNCQKASDGFCDTPPDYISERWSCDDNGLSLDTYMDPNGEEFKADAKNFMSYSYDRCQEYFSDQQKEMMFSVLAGEYNAIKYEFIPDDLLSGETIKAISPNENSDVKYDQVRLQWEPIPGVEEYIVQVSRFNGTLFDNGIAVNTNTYNNQIDLDPKDLRLDTRYYWRVVPVNSFTFCTRSSKEFSFVTREQTNIHQLPDGDKINIFPNVIHSGNPYINIKYELNSTKEFTVNLFDIRGRLMQQHSQKAAGDYLTQYSLAGLAPGMYALTLVHKTEVISERIIVQ